MLICRTDQAFRNVCRGKLTTTSSQAVSGAVQSKVQELFCARSASICSFINGARPSSHVTRPIIDLTKSKQHPGLRKLKHNIVFCNKSSAMSFFPPSQIIKIWLRGSTSSQCFTANRLVSWPAVLKLPFFHYPYLSISPPILPPQHTHAHSTLPEGLAAATLCECVCVCVCTAGSCQLQQ